MASRRHGDVGLLLSLAAISPSRVFQSEILTYLNSQICNQLFACFFILLIIIHYVRNVTADSEGLLVGARGFEADSDWRSLPDGHGTGGVRASVVGQDS